MDRQPVPATGPMMRRSPPVRLLLIALVFLYAGTASYAWLCAIQHQLNPHAHHTQDHPKWLCTWAQANCSSGAVESAPALLPETIASNVLRLPDNAPIPAPSRRIYPSRAPPARA